jgi:peptide/nickel transport system substrate-binding protein
VLFHDGTKVDASVVKFNIDRIMDPGTRSSMRTFYEPVHAVEVPDPYTVQIRLKYPYAFMMHMLAAYRMGLMFYSPTATRSTRSKIERLANQRPSPDAGPSSSSSG